MQFTRREFLIAVSLTGARCGRASTRRRLIYAGESRPPLERSAPTVCRLCPGGCGLRVRVVDDCAVGISGNPHHPINRGGVCARAPAAVQSLYNPDRLTEPLVLSGPRGSGRYRPTTWEDALEQLAQRLRTVRLRPGPQALAVVVRGERGLRRSLWSRFLQAYGSNNLVDWAPTEAHGAQPAVRAAQGYPNGIGYDLANARYVLSFASQWLDSHWSPVQASASLAALRGPQATARPKVVHFESRLSITGSKANTWIPARPGTEGTIALGIAHVLLKEDLYDRKFVEAHCHGFEDPTDSSASASAGEGERIGFRQLVLRDYPPSRVARISGVEEGTIFRVAREFAAAERALAIGYDGEGVSRQLTYGRMAIHALNALVGSVDVPGGVTHFRDLELLSGPLPEPDEAAVRGLSKARIHAADPDAYPLGESAPRLLAERLLAERPYAIDTLVLASGNPVFECPDPERMKRALSHVPFVVSLSPWLDDSTVWADLVIPDTHFLTRWDLDVAHTFSGHPTVTLGQPVLEAPEGLPKDSAGLLLDLAREIGEPVASALPYETTEEAVRAGCETLHGLGRGRPLGTQAEEDWTRLLENRGWKLPTASSGGSLFRKMVETGGWMDPVYRHREWDRVFRSPTRRFELHSSAIAARVKPRSAADDIRCLPHHEEAKQSSADDAFPYELYIYPLATLSRLTASNIPWLLDNCGVYAGERWESWVEINPETAASLGIEDRDLVVVTSPRGRVEVRARVFPGVLPQVVAMPWGLGHEGGGRWCAGIGTHPAALVEAQIDPLTSTGYWNATRVSLSKA